jgi:FixJ family two-component response regulator
MHRARHTKDRGTLKPPALRGSTGSHCLQSIAVLEAAWRTPQGISFLASRKLVFVVDDDPGMLRGVKRLLRQHAYDSVLFASAEAFQNQNDFEKALCVILDINLNDGSSGIELRHRLKAAGISVPVIYITGNDNPAVRMAALQSGCLAYLTKPFSAQLLIEPLERASAGLA